MTEPDNMTEHVARLSSMLTREGTRFLEGYEQRGEAVARNEATPFDRMANQAWFAQQFRLLPPYDRIIMEVIHLQVMGGLSVEESVEEMIEDAHQNPDRARDLIAYAKQLQVYMGEPLRQDMDVREAAEVLKRFLFEPEV
jgi:argininosuccinate lyase